MDLSKTMKELQNRASVLTPQNHSVLRKYLASLLEHYRRNEVDQEKVAEEILHLFAAVDCGEHAEVVNRLGFSEEILSQMKDQKKNRLRNENWPSKTGNPSGGHRGNASPKNE